VKQAGGGVASLAGTENGLVPVQPSESRIARREPGGAGPGLGDLLDRRQVSLDQRVLLAGARLQPGA
jgi:hypothetical protein